MKPDNKKPSLVGQHELTHLRTQVKQLQEENAKLKQLNQVYILAGAKLADQLKCPVMSDNAMDHVAHLAAQVFMEQPKPQEVVVTKIKNLAPKKEKPLPFTKPAQVIRFPNPKACK